MNDGGSKTDKFELESGHGHVCLTHEEFDSGTAVLNVGSGRRFHGAAVLCLGLLSVFLLAVALAVRCPRSSQRRFHAAAVVCLGLFSVFLLAGLVGLTVHYFDFVQRSAAELSAVKDNLTDSLQASNSEVLSLTEEKNLLNASLIETAKKLDWLKKTCPTGWNMISSSRYFFSTDSGSWDRGREECRARGGDLVVIDCREEQTFLSGFIRTNTWIGLNDRGEENNWKWIDGTPLTLA